MQSIGSLGLIVPFVGIVALGLALGVIIGAPIMAVPFVVVGFGAFLVSRGRRRAAVPGSRPYDRDRARVPGTGDTAADPAGDSGIAEATGSGSHRRRPDGPGV